MNFFVKVPDQLFDDLRDARIDSKMFLILAWMFRRADWAKGVVRKVSARRIQAEVWGNEHEQDTLSERSIQEKIKRLGLMGHVTSHHVDGRRGSYAVTLHNYPTQDDAGKDVVLNQRDTIGLDDLRDMLRADGCGELSGELSGEPSGEAAGSLPAELPCIRDYVPDSSQDSSQDSAQDSAPDSAQDSDQEKTSKEGSKQQNNPLAALAGQLCPENQDQEQHLLGSAGTEEFTPDELRLLAIADVRDADVLASIWEERTGSPLADDEAAVAEALASDHGLDEVGAILIDTFACPALRRIAWRDFRVWARNYGLNKGKVLGWRRSLGEEKAWVREEETGLALAGHVEAAERRAEARLDAELAVPDDFRCPYCGYGGDGERTRWCVDCHFELVGEAPSECVLGRGPGDCPECGAVTEGWGYCPEHGCERCGKKAMPGRRVCETCPEAVGPASDEEAPYRYQYRAPTPGEAGRFAALRGAGWADGAVSRMLKDGPRTPEQCGAAILRCLAEDRKVSWGEFICFVADAASRQPAAAAAE